MQKPKKKKRLPIAQILIIFLIILVIMVLDSKDRIVTTEYEVCSPAIPRSFDGLRIVQLSDLHEVVYGRDNGKLFKAIEKAEPDVIVITGDMIDADCPDVSEYVRSIAEGIGDMAPVFYVTGNHEWASGHIEELFDALEENGISVFRNGYTAMKKGGETVVLAGAEDPNGPYDMMTPEELVRDIREKYPDEYIIMLNHRNDRLPLFSELGVGLVLSGHAHGGIIRFPFTDGLIDTNRELFPTYTSGLYTEGDAAMVVSRGLGHNDPVPRFLNNPHIPVVILRAGSK